MILINDIYWTAGFLEGEGSFGSRYNSPNIRACQVEKYPVQKLKFLYGGSLLLDRRNGNPKYSPISRWQLCGIRAVGLMMSIYQLMSPKRQSEILNQLSIWRKALPYTGYRTHCPRGHPYLPTETRRKNGWRWCRECDRIRKKGESING